MNRLLKVILDTSIFKIHRYKVLLSANKKAIGFNADGF
jgi:hypothetical protein